MRTLMLLFLLPLCAKTQCPNPDSVILSRSIHPDFVPLVATSGYYHPQWLYSIFITAGPVQNVSIPPVNNDPATGQKIWLKNGFCRIYHPEREDTVLQATGRYLNGKKTGIWTWYDTEGNVTAKGKYANGLKTGIWEEFSAEGQEYAKGPYAAGRKEGLWKIYSDIAYTALIKKIPYHLGRIHGTSVYYENDRRMKQEQYKDGLIHGTLMEFYEDGTLSRKAFHQHGYTVNDFTYDYAGKLNKAIYYSKKMEIRTEIIYGENLKRIERYKNWQREGWTEEYTGGKLTAKTWYSKDRRNGYSMEINGPTKNEYKFKNDTLQGPYTVYEMIGGKWETIRTGSYKNGKQEGTWIERSGLKGKQYTEFKDGLRHGKYILLNDDADTVISAFYVNGKEHGRNLHVSGTEKTITQFKHGKRLVERRYSNDNKLLNEYFYHNEYIYDPALSKKLPGGRLREEHYGANGMLEQVKEFSAEGSDTFCLKKYFLSGKLKSIETFVDRKPEGKQLVLNEQGDTVSYSLYKNFTKTGHNIAVSAFGPQRALIFVSNFSAGMRMGEARIYYADTLMTNGEKKAKISLAADGTMFKGQPFEHWTIYTETGTVKYDGCLCGAEQRHTESWQATAYFYPLQTIDPERVLNAGIRCGNYTSYDTAGRITEKQYNGLYQSYYPNGHLKETGKYANGYKQGTWLEFDAEGRKIKEEQYNYWKVNTVPAYSPVQFNLN